MSPLILFKINKASSQLPPGGTGKGYFGGGYTPTNVRTNYIDGLDFSTEAAINPSAVLSRGRNGLAGVYSTSRGYFAGGYNVHTEIDGIQFDTEAAINPGAVLATGRYCLAGVSSSYKGYFGGGSSTKEIDGIHFDTEVAINPSAALYLARHYVSGLHSGIRGYFCSDTSFEIFRFDNESRYGNSYALNGQRVRSAGASSVTAGYLGGGTVSAGSAIAALDFSTETPRVTAAYLTVFSSDLAALNSTARGYFGGGGVETDYTNRIDGLDFATESNAAQSAVLSLTRGSLAGVSSR